MKPNLSQNRLRAGMVGLGMIFDDTYRPMFEQLHAEGLYRRDFGYVDVELAAVASLTGKRAERYKQSAAGRIADFKSFAEPDAVGQLLPNVDVVCVATPDNRHFEPAKQALQAGNHVLIEKPCVLSLQELDELEKLARQHNALAKVVYHKLADPDHKKMRTHYANAVLQHVNTGYCTLLEPKLISGSQFAEWITGRNPGTYVACHYIKLIDFSFAAADMKLHRITANGQRGIVARPDGNTWDSVQLQMVYRYDDGREAAFDIHTSWVTPDNYPGYVEQEVQFRFDNGVWTSHQRKRGVELTVEGKSPGEFKITPNHHYNADYVEPWGERSQRGYGIEILRRFMEEAAFVEFGGKSDDRPARLEQMRALTYNDVSVDRNTVATVQAMEAILARHAAGQPGSMVEVNGKEGGLVLRMPGQAEAEVLYPGRV